MTYKRNVFNSILQKQTVPLVISRIESVIIQTWPKISFMRFHKCLFHQIYKTIWPYSRPTWQRVEFLIPYAISRLQRPRIGPKISIYYQKPFRWHRTIYSYEKSRFFYFFNCFRTTIHAWRKRRTVRRRVRQRSALIYPVERGLPFGRCRARRTAPGLEWSAESVPRWSRQYARYITYCYTAFERDRVRSRC